MRFVNAIFNVFTGVFDCTNCVFHVLDYVRQNFAVVFCPCNRLFVANYVFCVNNSLLYLHIVLLHIVLCMCAILLFVFRIMFFQIRVFRDRDRPLWSGASNKLCTYFPRKENRCRCYPPSLQRHIFSLVLYAS